MSEYTGIVCNDVEALLARCFVSGVRITKSRLYVRGAIVPDVAACRVPDAEDIKPFLATEQTPEAGRLELIGPTDELGAALSAYTGTKTYPTTSLPRQLSTTMNTDEGLLEGMHYDAQHNLPMSERLSSPRRVAYNYGPGDRFLQVGSVDVFDLAGEDYDSAYRPSSDDLRDAVRRGRVTMSALWVHIPPKTGYVGPTELVGHDGATLTPMPGMRMSYPNRGSYIRFWIGHWTAGAFGSLV